MKTFYVLFDGSHYLYDDPDLMDRFGIASYTEYLSEAMQFESLHQAHQFLDSSGLELEILRVEITSVYTPNLFTEKLPECTDIQNTTNKD